MDISVQLKVAVVVDDKRCTIERFGAPVLEILQDIFAGLGKGLALLCNSIVVTVRVQAEGYVSWS